MVLHGCVKLNENCFLKYSIFFFRLRVNPPGLPGSSSWPLKPEVAERERREKEERERKEKEERERERLQREERERLRELENQRQEAQRQREIREARLLQRTTPTYDMLRRPDDFREREKLREMEALKMERRSPIRSEVHPGYQGGLLTSGHPSIKEEPYPSPRPQYPNPPKIKEEPRKEEKEVVILGSREPDSRLILEKEREKYIPKVSVAPPAPLGIDYSLKSQHPQHSGYLPTDIPNPLVPTDRSRLMPSTPAYGVDSRSAYGSWPSVDPLRDSYDQRERDLFLSRLNVANPLGSMIMNEHFRDSRSAVNPLLPSGLSASSSLYAHMKNSSPMSSLHPSASVAGFYPPPPIPTSSSLMNKYPPSATGLPGLPLHKPDPGQNR